MEVIGGINDSMLAKGGGSSAANQYIKCRSFKKTHRHGARGNIAWGHAPRSKGKRDSTESAELVLRFYSAALRLDKSLTSVSRGVAPGYITAHHSVLALVIGPEPRPTTKQHEQNHGPRTTDDEPIFGFYKAIEV